MEYVLGLYEKAMPTGLPWREMLEACRDAGFDQLEISIDETDFRQARLNWTQKERARLKEVSADVGVPIATMCLSGHRKYPLGSHSPELRNRALHITRQAIDLACDLGIRIIQLAGYDVYYEDSDDETKAWFEENLFRCVEYASRQGVPLGFETMETPFMDTISKSMACVTKISSAYLGIYPDLGNLTNACKQYGTTVTAEIHLGIGHLLAMHLKETLPGKYRNMDFGNGHVDFASGIQEATACGINMFTAEFWYDGGIDWKDRLKRTNHFLRSKFPTVTL